MHSNNLLAAILEQNSHRVRCEYADKGNVAWQKGDVAGGGTTNHHLGFACVRNALRRDKFDEKRH
jgi:hypothetical protein